jgi:sigma-54-specific transcriptional regulator
VAELEPALQSKLLRALQEGEFQRVGGNETVRPNVRVLAATNVDLRDAVSAGHFRADLYYRLSVATLELRPLCERPGDILPLARHFLASYAQRLGIAHAALAPDAQQALLAHDWPGNIRELENVIHFALIVAPAATLHASDLQAIQRSVRSVGRPRAAEAPAPPQEVPVQTASSPVQALRELLQQAMEREEPLRFEQIELAAVSTAYAFCDGNQVRSARLLGVSRNVLRTLLKRHGLLDSQQAPTREVDEVWPHLLAAQQEVAASP